MTARLLVVGAGGLLGGEVVRAARRQRVDGGLPGAGALPRDDGALPRDDVALPGEVVALTRDDLDITDPRAVDEVVRHHRPDVLVNAAAATDVDGCERDPDTARRVNAEAPGHLAEACTRAGAKLVHLSTDYVFSGQPPPAEAHGEHGGPGGSAGDLTGDRTTPGRGYREDDPTGPISVYGRTKLDGEDRVRATSPDHLVVRTAWLSGPAGGFVPTILRLTERHADDPALGPLRVVADQTGSPTVADDLAVALLRAVAAGATGTLHLANQGATTWHEVAMTVVAAAGLDVEVAPQPAAALDRPAPRPAWSVLDTGRARTLGIVLRPWEDAVTELVATLRSA